MLPLLHGLVKHWRNDIRFCRRKIFALQFGVQFLDIEKMVISLVCNLHGQSQDKKIKNIYFF